MKYLLSILFLFMLTAATAAQEIGKDERTVVGQGMVSGVIVMKEVVGNGLSKFKCANLVVSANKLGGGWQLKTRSSGDFTKRRCTFVLPPIPSGEQFVAVLNAQMPSCDQKTFNTTTSLPMRLKPGEAMRYNFAVTKISCVLLK